MNVLTAFWVSFAVAVSIALLTVLLLRRPLDVLLSELCGSASRARFWMVFTSIAIVLTALLGMLVSFPLDSAREWSDYPHLPAVLGAFRTSLSFLLLSLGGLAFVLLLGISSYERNRRYAPRSPSDGGWGSGTPPPVGT